MTENDRVQFNGVKFYAFKSLDDVITHVEANPGILVAINARKLNYATDETRAIINRNIGYCDGIGAIKALKMRGIKSAVRIPGCELWLKIIERRYKEGWKFYFVGGKQNIIDTTIDKLKREFPGIEIAGYRNGYINTEEEKQNLLNDIKDKKPNVVFVAMGSPKQELLMEDMLKLHPAIYQGLGGSFDIYSGYLKRAPKWFIDHNMESLYRLIQNPSRFIRASKSVWFMIRMWLGKYKD